MLRLSFTAVRPLSFEPAPAVSTLLFKRTRSTVAAAKEDLEVAKPFNEMPGPKPLPLIGNNWRFLPVVGEFRNKSINELVHILRNTYGDIVKLSNIHGINDIVYLFNPKDIETLFRNEGPWPVRPGMKSIPHYRSFVRNDFFKGIDGLLVSQGKPWYDFRTRVNQTMMQPRNTKLYVGPIDEVTMALIGRMRSLKNADGELPKNFIDYLMLWALESIALIALDTRLGCLDPEMKEDSEPQQLIKAVNYMFTAMYELDVKPSLRHVTKHKQWNEFIANLDKINEVTMKYIRRAMDNIQNKVASGEKEMSVLETLLIKNEDPMYAVVMAIDMMTAGIDTTSHSSAMLLHFLARNQDKQEILFQELKTILPSKEQPITAKNLEDMKYLKACMKESMRMSPITSGTARETPKEVVLSNFLVPKGVTVVTAIKYICADETHFPEPDLFIPERWMKDNAEHRKPDPFVFLPFGFGPRMCVGRRFAELEIETLLARIFRNFRLNYDQELEIISSIINTVVSPLNFKLEDRP